MTPTDFYSVFQFGCLIYTILYIRDPAKAALVIMAPIWIIANIAAFTAIVTSMDNILLIMFAFIFITIHHA